MKINIKKYIPLFLTIAGIISIFAPFQTNSPLGSDSLRNLLKIISYILVGISFLITITYTIKNRIKNEISIILSLLSFISYFLLSVFHTVDNNIEFSGLLILIACITYVLLDNDTKKKTFELFKKTWIIISAISIICYLSYVLNGFIPYHITKYYSLRYYSTDIYISYGISFLYESGKFVRLCGITNEAGFFGTICALLLCADRVKIKNKGNIIIVIAGFLTYSFAFYMIILAYLLLKSFKDIKAFVIVLIVIISYLFIIPNIKFNNPNIDYLIERFTIKEGRFKGDNRSNEMLDNAFYYTLKKHPVLGMGKGYVSKNQIGGVSSYKTYIVEYGVLGFILIYGLLICSAIIYNRKNYYGLLYIIVFFLSVYQRPNIIILPYMILLFGGIAKLFEYENEKVIINNKLFNKNGAKHEKTNENYKKA